MPLAAREPRPAPAAAPIAGPPGPFRWKRKDREPILPLRVTDDGWSVLTIHHSKLPDYDFEAACKGMSEEAIQRELEIDWSATIGKRVYPDFRRDRHVAARKLPFDPRKPLYCGWDFGGTPAFVPTQVASTGQWYLYPGLVPPDEQTWGIYEFAQQVADYLTRNFAIPHGLTLEQLNLIHIGDPAGNGPPPRAKDSPKEERSCFQILNRGMQVVTGHDDKGRAILTERPGWGWRVMPGAVNITDRLESVRSRLTLMVHGGEPALLVDPEATTLIEGFLGGYHYHQRADGRYEFDPYKNWYSHPMDALGYVATRLFARGQKRSEEDEDAPPRHQFQSVSARRGR